MSEIIVSREAIKADILAGYSKRSTDKGFNPEIGSIMEKYDFNEKQLRLIFQDPEIKATKYKKPKSTITVVFEEDLSEDLFRKLVKKQKVKDDYELPELVEANTVVDEDFSPF